VVTLLQGALSDAKPEQNGVEATPGESEMKPVSKQKDKSISMAKITSYGEGTVVTLWRIKFLPLNLVTYHPIDLHTHG
jgi:hypothetical protein